MSSEIERVMVIGAGQMGSGIAQVAAQAGFEVVLQDAFSEALSRGRHGIERSLEKFVQKEQMSSEDRDAVLARIRTSERIEEGAESDLIVEAVPEREELKIEVLQRVDAIAPSHAILATNTSSISITRLAARTNRPEQVVGMHFMNPVPLMKLVELIRGLQTSDATFSRTRAAAEAMGKTCVDAQDFPGFIVNRILMPMINEAVYALMEGVGSAEDIDAAMKLGTNQPMGPLTLADFIGLDTCLAIMEVLHEGLGDSKYRPCPLLRTYVDAGWLGRKCGRGFHDYTEQR